MTSLRKQVWKAYRIRRRNADGPDKTMTWTDGAMKPSARTRRYGRASNGSRRRHDGLAAYAGANLLPMAGNPSTWNPARPGDNKWSMTISRDVDIGMAKWAFQMTPYGSDLMASTKYPVLSTSG
jgi:glucose dehydrogenase